MIEKPTTGHIPVGYVDQYGNFELLASDWMQEEPGIVWKPVFFEGQSPLEYPWPYSHDPAAPVAQPDDAYIKALEAEREELRFLENDLLYWVGRTVSKGNANSDTEEAWERYEAFLNKRNTAA